MSLQRPETQVRRKIGLRPERPDSYARTVFRRLRSPALRAIDRMLQRIVPISSRRVCYFSRPDYDDNAYYVYRHLLQTRHNLEHVWILVLPDPGLSKRIRGEFERLTARAGTTGNSLRVVPKHSLRGYLLYLASRTAFHTHGHYSYSDRPGRRQIVCVWHGMPIKCIGRLNHVTPNQSPTYGSVHIATSPFFRYIIAAAFGAPPESVVLCGQPRCDAFLSPQAVDVPAQELRRNLRIPEEHKLILWMPTYRTELTAELRRGNVRSFADDLPAWVLPALERHCERHRCTIVAKLHVKDPCNDRDLALEGPHIRLLRAEDWLAKEIPLYDLVSASDALLSDVSSVLIDYLVTDRPIGIVGFDRATYTRALTFPIDWILASRRFHHLQDESVMTAFFKAVESATPCRVPANDTATILHDMFPETGSAQLLNALGL